MEGLAPPETTSSLKQVTVEDARKLLRAAKLEVVKSKLRNASQSCVSYSEFVRICEENCSDRDEAKKVAKMLDDSATVIVLGDVVFLRPEQVNSYFSLPFSFSISISSLNFFFFRYIFSYFLFVGLCFDLWDVTEGDGGE